MEKELSIVIPIYRGANSIRRLVEQLEVNLAGYNFEMILVNDGSPDDSHQVCQALQTEFSNITFVSLRRNFGEFNAVMAGLQFVTGKYAVIIDDDFQNPPSEILKLVETAQTHDFDVVYSYYATKRHAFYRNVGSQLVNYLTTFLLKKPKDLYLSSFKLIHWEVVQEIIKYRGAYPYIDGLIFQVTNHIGRVEVAHHERMEGDSNYTWRKLISLFLTILFGYSLLPLRVIFLLGSLSVVFALGYFFLYFADIINHWGSPVVIFLCGVLMCSLAIVGEYIGKSYMMLNGQPQYVIRTLKKRQDAT